FRLVASARGSTSLRAFCNPNRPARHPSEYAHNCGMRNPDRTRDSNSRRTADRLRNIENVFRRPLRKNRQDAIKICRISPTAKKMVVERGRLKDRAYVLYLDVP